MGPLPWLSAMLERSPHTDPNDVQLRERLAALASRIRALLAGSEDVFLETGSELKAIEQRARRLLDASSAARSIGETSPEERLADDCVRIERYLELTRAAFASQSSELEPMLQRLENVAAFGGSFQQTSTTLQALAICMRVEDARAGACSGFETVVADVRRLGAQFEPCVAAIAERVKLITESAAAARESAGIFSRRETELSAVVLAEAKGALASISRLASTAAQVAASASKISEQLVRSVGAVLVAMQVHDLTRQMVEHVVEELDELSGRDGLRRVPLSGVGQICRLQTSQLRTARRKLLEGQSEIARNLRAISDSTRALAERTCQLAGRHHEESWADQVGRGMSEAARVLREHLEQERSAWAAMDAAAQRVVEMREQLGRVGDIGSGIKVIALNAVVKAVKMGSSGQALAVLARAVQELAVALGSSTTAISRGMTECADMAETLRAQRRSELLAASGEAEQVLADLDGELARLRARQAALASGSEAMLADSAALSESVGRLEAAMARQATRTAEMESVEAELEAIARQAGHLGKADGHGRLAAVSSRYTAELEREVHAQVIGAAKTISDTPIPASGSELGDNVELF